ncbi:MAG: CPBP family glutamic-type intramembrane protease, partial [Gammaproteobacteria bacterium]|nr:CPBP family glutamic-type intramembrane protease [Gammaproteobacteria bacterium]
LAIGWGVGGFLEELTFRGFVVGRLRWLLGSGSAATWAAVVVAAVTFGVAHAYQGVSGMIATGLTGLIVGALYVLHRFNVWYVIFTHGFINTAGILAIYLDIDRPLARVLFG